MKKLNLLFIVSLLSFSLYSQRWIELMSDTSKNFYEIQTAFNEEWEGREYQRGNGWKQFKRWEWFMEQRVYPSGNRIPTQSAYKERKDFERNYGNVSNKNGSWTPLGFNQWNSTSYNPGIGRINVIAEDPSNSQIIYAGTPAGGLWKSTDAGVNWLPLTDHFPSLGVSGVVIDYNNPNNIYIATGDKDSYDTYSIGVVKSSDGGATWNVTGLVHSLSQFVVCRKLVMHPTNPNILLLATNEGIYKTTDGGVSWSQTSAGDFRDIEYHPTNPGIVFASQNEFYRSTDGGDSFSLITGSLPHNSLVTRMELAVSPDQPSWVYAICGKSSDGTFQGLYRSTDAGLTFQQQSNSPNILGYAVAGDDNSGQSWYDLAIEADPTNASTIFIGGINVWKSTNAGVDWTINTHWYYPTFYGYTHADIHELKYIGNRLYCGSDGGIFRTNDSGGNWTDLTQGMQISQFYRIGGSPQNSNTLIGGTQDNGSNLFKNNVWTHVMGADGMEAAIHPSDPNVMFCTYQFGGMRRSLDGGASWNTVFTGDGVDGGWITPYEVLPSDKVIAGYENVWIGENNGDFFYPISNFSGSQTIRDLDVAKSNNDIIYVSRSNEVHKTEDLGNSWTNVTSNLPNLMITDIQIHPSHPQIVWVTTSGYSSGNKVFVTVNGGNTWQNISQNLPNIPANTIVYQEGTDGGLYVGMDVGVYYIDSTFSNWQTFDTGIPNVIISELEIHYGSNLIRAATYGRGVWESALFTPSALPPQADFTHSSTEICSQDSISFTDASLNASPSWTWYFPGGSPSTSNLSSPKVLYTTDGNYTVSLVVQNNNGTDSISKSIAVSTSPGVNVNLEIQTDQYPSETSWELFTESGNSIFSGGNYSNENLYTETFCLEKGCYEFKIYDAYGDGICCEYGNGYYQLFDDQGIIVQGGDYWDQETTIFCVLGADDDLNLNQSNEENFRIFPNPANNFINISPANPEEYSIKILDQTGRVIIEKKSVNGFQKLDLTNMAQGIYQIWLENENLKSSLQFVKN